MTDFTPPDPTPAVPSVASLNLTSAVRWGLGLVVGVLLTRFHGHLSDDQMTQLLNFGPPLLITAGSATWIALKNKRQKSVVVAAIAAPAPK